jgi:DNA-binding MurR/RpiR family transcriptional regulator
MKEQHNSKTVIDRITSLMDTFSPTNEKIARFVIQNKHDIGFASVLTMSKQAEVSKASIVRFAQAVGFEGFNQLKKAIQEELKVQLSPYSKILLKDLDILSKEKQLKKLVSNEITNLNKTLNNIDIVSLMEIIKQMEKANKIFISGFGGNGPVAKRFVHSMKIVTDKQIEHITGAVSDFSPALSSLCKNDVVFILTLPSYSLENFYLAKYAKEKQAHLCLLTESPECPLYSMADVVLLCENNSLSLANSYVAIVAMTQIITDMFFLSCKEEGIRSVKAVRDMAQNEYNHPMGK